MRELRVLKWTRRVFADFLWWAFYQPLFKTGKVVMVEVFHFGGESFEVDSTKTWFFGKILYSVARELYQNEVSGESFIETMARCGTPVRVQTIASSELADLQNAHPALKDIDPEKLEVYFCFA
ncbi:MAG: hypothetical protein A2Z24_02295 [Candidatus Woykebacteria bacterium RBG_16_44_10]|uniref:Uncharacterized protein n=1 Tax=Candidatus Woykebacteria bacterium RBG_16_44_10 TaxID=1802597 RepID=A0A1G1WFZ4_9BACT|nr:MAG: hypothetical protein A2Z24_02295 [Candidatus Woykebacteria bacterium RBG_16_44_10]